MEVQEFNRLNQVFSFRRPRSTVNRLINKNIPGVNVEERDNIVECRDSQSEPTVLSLKNQIVRSENPLENDGIAAYFEVEILGTSSDDTINVGLMAKDNTTKQHLGRTNNSFGYYRGDLFLNKRKVGGITPPQKLKVGDYIGIGINCLKRTFFMIKNGKVISQSVNIPTSWNEFYPAVGVSHENEKVQVTFNPKEVKFEYFDFAKEIQKEVESDIKKEEVSSSKIYPLVFEYLQFHGYTKTLSMLNEREKQIHKLPKLCKNPSLSTPAINLNTKSNQKMMGQDQDMNQPLKIRHRIMSEILDEKQQLQMAQVKRKNTQMVGNGRKDSLLSNLSNISNYNNSQGRNGPEFYCEEEQKDMIEDLDQNQKFLLNQKVEIVRLVKEKNIQMAIQLIEKHIPLLFVKEQYILAFLKAHIFLRIIKEESSTAALKFSQNQKDLFSKYSGSMFPYYNSEGLGIEWKPLKFIYTALAYNAKNSKKQKYVDMLSDKQFQYFAMYLNSTILQNMGYVGISRLGYCIKNSKKVLEKLNGYKGMPCGVELKL